MTTILTFKDLYTQFLTYTDLTTDTGQGLSMAKYAIQTANERRLTQERWTFMLWENPVTINFISGQRVYTLHPLAGMVTDFANFSNSNTSAQGQMRETPSRARYKVGVQNDRFHFEFVKDSPVKLQPALVAPVTITGGVRIVYLNSSGDAVQEDITNNVTSQNVQTILQVTKLTDVAVTLVDSSSNTLLSLAVGEFGKTYPQIRLFDVGVTGETGQYRFYKKPGNLVHDNDIPEIPYPYSRILVYDALLEYSSYNDAKPDEYWLRQQSILEAQMRQAFQEGEMEGAEARQVQETDAYGG
jgi:hypothetical protein